MGFPPQLPWVVAGFLIKYPTYPVEILGVFRF